MNPLRALPRIRRRPKPYRRPALRLFGVEPLEDRRLLAIDSFCGPTANAWDAAMGSQLLSVATSSTSAASASSTASLMSGGDQHQSSQEEVLASALPDDDDLVAFRLEVTNTSGTPISSLNIGEDFVLNVYVRDLREPGDSSVFGVIAAFTDVTFDSQLVTVDGPINHGTIYTQDPHGDTNTTGVLNEVGGLSSQLTPLGTTERLLFSVPFTATAAGTLNFTADEADDLPTTDTLLYADAGVDPTVDTPNISYGLPVSLTVNGPPKLSIDDVTVSEADGTATFTVTLTAPSDEVVTVNYQTQEVSADEGDDYTAANNMLTFQPGQTQQTLTIPVTIVNDTLDELDETFIVKLSGATNATIDDDQGVGTITDNDDPPVISIRPATPGDISEGANTVDFIVELSAASGRTVTVEYETVVDTAIGGLDYQIASQALTFAPGETQKTVTITIINDSLDENDETFSVELSDASNATLSPTQGSVTGTIVDDDPLPTISIAPAATIDEGDTGTRPMTFNVTLSAASGRTVTVHYAATGGTATEGSDYQSASGTLTFLPGEALTQQITVNIVGDVSFELDETVQVALDSPSNAALGTTSTASGTIDNDDDEPIASISPFFFGLVEESQAGTQDAQFDITLSSPAQVPVTIFYKTVAGTASEGSDYVGVTMASVTFDPGQQSMRISIDVRNDAVDEADSELFQVMLTSAENADISETQHTATGVINDDDPLPVVSVTGPASIVEGNNGTKTLQFTVSLSAASGREVTVNYATSPGTADEGVDYESAIGAVTFAAGEVSKTVTVTINGDTEDELDEDFTVELSAPSNAVLSDTQPAAETTILDDEPIVSIVNADVFGVVDEAEAATQDGLFNIKLSSPATVPVTVFYRTVGVTATGDLDYTQVTNGSVTFEIGQQTKQIAIDILQDALDEDGETYRVEIVSAAGAVVSTTQASATGAIADDDPTPTISIRQGTPSSVSETDAGTITLNYVVELSAASGQTVTVDFAIAGTATTGSDFDAPASLQLTFDPGQVQKTISITIKQDALDEADETVIVELTEATAANISQTDDSATGTIVDDDPAPTISIEDATAQESDGTIQFTVRLSAASGQDVTFNLDLTGVTATEGQDYTEPTGQFTIPAGQTTLVVSVPLIVDDDDEPNETFTAALANVANAAPGDGSATGTIVDDISVTVADASIGELDTGATSTMVFQITLSRAAAHDITLNFTIDSAGLTRPATAGTDFVVPSSLQVVIPAGQTTGSISIVVNGDLRDEFDEQFRLTFTEAHDDVSLSDDTAIGTILEDPDPQPTISLGNGIVRETDTGDAMMVFTVSLSAVSGKPVTFKLDTTSGTATEGVDFTEPTQLFTIPAGTQSITVSVPIKPDNIVEGEEAFTVALAEIANATTANQEDITATGTIVDDDNSASIVDETITESNSEQLMTFTILLAKPATEELRFRVTSANGSATSVEDFVALSNVLVVIPEGQDRATFTVRIVGDTRDEASENFTVTVSAEEEDEDDVTIADPTAQGTIEDNDPPPTISIENATVREGDNNDAEMVFTVRLTSPSGKDVTFKVNTTGGTATKGDDFGDPTTTSFTIPKGQTQATVRIPVRPDDISEGNEKFTVTLTEIVNAEAGDIEAEGTIDDDDDDIVASIEPAKSVNENNRDPSFLEFTVTLSKASTSPITLNYSTSAGDTQPAAGNVDYDTVTNGQIAFAPGETSKTIRISVRGDRLDEFDEQLKVTLSENVPDLVIGPGAGVGVGTILDNDEAPEISIENGSIKEGDGNAVSMPFIVRLRDANGNPISSGKPIDFTVLTTSGTAVAGQDFTQPSQGFTINPGSTTFTVNVSVLPDDIEEGTETFTATLSNVTEATVDDGTATGTIIDEDDDVTYSVANASVTEGNGSNRSLVFTVTLNKAADEPVTLSYATTSTGFTATAGVDYTAVNNQITFAPGQTSKTITVQILGDRLDEADERFGLNITEVHDDVSPASDDPIIGTITDNDDPPKIRIANARVVEGDAGTVQMVFVVTLSEASGRPVVFNIQTSDGTATAGTDYTTVSSNFTISAGFTTLNVSVPVLADGAPEEDEKFRAVLTVVNAGTAEIDEPTDGSASGTILDGDFSSVSGFVFVDADNDNRADAGEQPLGGVLVRLVGTQEDGTAVNRTVRTKANGSYIFEDLREGDYRLTEVTPVMMRDGKDRRGTGGDNVEVFNDRFEFELATDEVMSNFNFGERGLMPEFVTRRTGDPNGILMAIDLDAGEMWYAVENENPSVIQAIAASEDPRRAVELSLYDTKLRGHQVQWLGNQGDTYLIRLVGATELFDIDLVD